MVKIFTVILPLVVAAAGGQRVSVALSADVGQSVHLLEEATVKQAVTVHDAGGKVLKATTVTEVVRLESITTTVRKGAGAATYRAEFQKAEVEIDGRREPMPLQGKKFTITVRGDKIGLMSSDGRPLDDATRALLEDGSRQNARAESNNVCVPTDPLAVGATWALTLEQVDACFGGESQARAGSGSGGATLKAVDGGYATIEFRFSERIANVGSLVFDGPSPVEGTAQLRVSLSDPLEWTRTVSYHFSGTAHPHGPAQPWAAIDGGTTEMTRSRR